MYEFETLKAAGALKAYYRHCLIVFKPGEGFNAVFQTGNYVFIN